MRAILFREIDQGRDRLARKMNVFIDPIACNGHGMCAELLPELIELDDWGFPVIKNKEVPASLLEIAWRAERVCPTLALRIRERL